MDMKLMRSAIVGRILIFSGKPKVHRLNVDSTGFWCYQPWSIVNGDVMWWETAHLENQYLHFGVISNVELMSETPACCLM